MNVEVENLPNCITTLRVEVPPDKVTQAWDHVAKDYTQYAKIPGYRPGKAPRTVVESRFKKQIREEVEKKLLQESCREAIDEKKLRVLSLAEVQDVEFGADKMMRFTATLVTEPEFELPEYKGIPVEAPSSEVTEKEVDDAMDDLRERQSDYEDITDRPLAMEDFAVLDYDGTFEGKPIDEALPKVNKLFAKNVDFWIPMTPESFFPGFAPNLVGAKIGETRTFDVEIPADFPLEDLAGKKLTYTATVKGIKLKKLPEWTDELAGRLAEGKTVAELKELVRGELQARKASEINRAKKDQIMTNLLSKVECELPVNLVRSETKQVLAEMVRTYQNQGKDDDFLKEKEKELVDNAGKAARDRLRSMFILRRVAETENIKVTKEELSARIHWMAEQYRMPIEKLMKELSDRDAFGHVSDEILTAKALDFLASNASVTAK